MSECVSHHRILKGPVLGSEVLRWAKYSNRGRYFFPRTAVPGNFSRMEYSSGFLKSASSLSSSMMYTLSTELSVPENKYISYFLEAVFQS